MTTYIGDEQYNKIEIKNGQAIILEPMVYHSFESELLQYIEFKGTDNAK
jgi:D-lyxose ketol-isomerase